MPCLSSCLPGCNPAVPFSTKKNEGPSGVSARMVYRSATAALVMNCFCPLSLYPLMLPESSRTRSAFVFSAWTLEPAFGSVTP